MKSKYEFELKTFEDMLEGKPLSKWQIIRLSGTAMLDPFRMFINYLPGPAGYGVRRLIYKNKFESLGKNCLIDVGLRVTGHKNISISEYTWIDCYAALFGLFGPISIGKRVHISPFCVVAAGEEGVEIHDYAGLSTGSHLWGHTQAPMDGLRMSGPMIPWRYKAVKEGKIVLERDSFIGSYALVLPGVRIGEGAVVGAHSVVHKDVAPWSIVSGVPARVIGKREKVTVPEI